MNVIPFISILTLIFALLLVSELFSVKRKVRKMEKRLNMMWDKMGHSKSDSI